MKLIIISVLMGILCILPILPFTLNGSRVDSNFILVLWLTGFLSPGLYTLDKLSRNK